MVPVFKRHAAKIIKENLSGHVNQSKRVVSRFLESQKTTLSRWYGCMLIRLLTAGEFSSLFDKVRSAFSLKELIKSGIPSGKVREITRAILNLLKKVMIVMSGCNEVHNDPDEQENNEVQTFKKELS